MIWAYFTIAALNKQAKAAGFQQIIHHKGKRPIDGFIDILVANHNQNATIQTSQATTQAIEQETPEREATDCYRA